MLRFAPSPTGDMHIGNLRAALFNHIIAQQTKQPYLLRIDDTDQERHLEEKVDQIVDLLKNFGLKFTNIVRQSDNRKFHYQLATQLLSDHKAFSCFCTKEDLETKKQKAKDHKKAYRYDDTCSNLNDNEVIDNQTPFTVRIKKPVGVVDFTDGDGQVVHTPPETLDSFVILRQDKSPTYNFACAADDMIHAVTLVIRGADHLSNTPKQQHILQALGYDNAIAYLHLPLILNESGKKMSKRESHSSVKTLLDKGFLPSAICNYLISMGNQTPQEVFTLEEAIEWFDIKKLSKSSPKFDIDQLRFLNRAHIKNTDDTTLAALLSYHGAAFGQIAKLYLEEASTLQEIKQKIDPIFAPKLPLESFAKEFEMIFEYCQAHLDTIKTLEFNVLKQTLSDALDLKGKFLLKPLRFLLTQKENGPNLSDLYPLIQNYLTDIIRK